VRYGLVSRWIRASLWEKLQEQLREFLINATSNQKYAEYELKLCAEYIKE
jgi:hypothetical protein